ncbi:Proton-dependent oligopeptide transporter family [Macleaya cordata]|uniref:Proton-dependent oligopeptide transporter family n=1 Tax=Macleaya cordata TaxID=56857 RepID=A0A200RCC8_MACCD|nr:Proton-dependent oligopeptide transporter family [Macleaya cordata]
MDGIEPAAGEPNHQWVQYEKVGTANKSHQEINGKNDQDEKQLITTTIVSNGCVDVRGRIADKRTTGGWKASPFIIVNEAAERLAFYAIAVNMVSYLVREMHQSLPNAATHVTDWIGAAFVLTLLGAFVADAYLGRFLTIIVFSCIYAVGMVLLTLSASLDSLRPPPCVGRACEPATKRQTAFLYSALALIALGTGGIKPCVSSFGADQFDDADEKEVHKKYSFFNWFFFAINIGALLGITLLVYVQVEKGWAWGFGVPTIAMMSSIVILAAGVPFYRYQKPMGSAFTRFIQVGAASVKNHLRGVEVRRETLLFEVKTKESDIFVSRDVSYHEIVVCCIHIGRFLDKAAVITNHEADTTNRWNLCTVTQVEEFKSFIRVLPVWASTIALSISFAQLSTFFISQALIMDRKLGSNFRIPAGSIPVFSAMNALILVPIYEGWIVPILRRRTGHRRGITSLQRMGVGLFISIFAMVSAAVVEKRRREHYSKPFSMSVFWLLPQFFLIGSAEVFTYVGQLEFFYDEATDGTRSLSSAMFLSEIGIGSWLSTALVKIIERTTGGEDKGWLRNKLNESRLDYFYWVLMAISAVNFLIYLVVAWLYKGRDDVGSSVRDETMVVDQVQGDEDANKVDFFYKTPLLKYNNPIFIVCFSVKFFFPRPFYALVIYVTRWDLLPFFLRGFQFSIYKEDSNYSQVLVSNGCVDFRGRMADKRTTGGWKATPFIVVNEAAERLAYYAVAVNIGTYLVQEMHQSLPDAATHVTNWVGLAFGSTLFGAFIADAYLGRFLNIFIFSCVYAVGMVLLTLSGSHDSLRPPPCVGGRDCQPATKGQTAFLYSALALIGLGTGGIKPCVSSFGADQFDNADKNEIHGKFSFFNWFFFAINTGALLGITLIPYLQVQKGWGWGFAVPTGAIMCSIIILAAGVPLYRYQKPMGSAFTRFIQVGAASVRNHFRGVEVRRDSVLFEVKTNDSDIFGSRKLSRTTQYRFLDKAAVITNHEADTTNRWNLCTVTQVEEFKSFIRVLPVWASTIALSISYAQLSSFFISQASIMDRKLGSNFVIPIGSVTVFAVINALILVPIYEGWMVPILRRWTGHRRGITSLQRMGVGLFISIFAFIAAAVVEKRRREHYSKPMSMSVFWLLPQFMLMSSAEVFTYVGQLEFFYNEATDGTRSLSSAMFLSEIGIGSWLSTALVKIIEGTTGGEDKGWLRNKLNDSRLDYFYWLLMAISTVNFFIYLLVASHYKGRDDVGSSVRDESVVELQPADAN